MQDTINILLLLSLVFFIYTIIWMNKMLKYSKSIKVMQSMMLQIEKKKAEKEGLIISLEELHTEASKHA
jgi:hypothetical protein